MQPVHAQLSGSPALLWQSSGAPLAAILLIPGNPGVCSYYEEYADAMHRALGRQSTILCPSLLGHHGEGPPPSGTVRAFGRARSFYTVQDQIDALVHALDRLEAMHEERVPLVLIGHSVGAYAAQRIFAAHSHRIDSVHYLFPTLAHIAKQPRACTLAPLLAPHGTVLVYWLAVIFSLLPYILILPLVMLLTGMRGRYAAITTTFTRSPRAVFNALSMARDEMFVIRDFDPDIIRATAGAPARDQTIRAFWAPGNADSWAPAPARAYAEEHLHLERVPALDTAADARPFRTSTVVSGMSHAFILHKSHEMALITAAYVSADVAARNARLLQDVSE